MNSPVVRIACMTCCLLNGREKDAETSKDLGLDVEELKKQNKNENRLNMLSSCLEILGSIISSSHYLDFCRS